MPLLPKPNEFAFRHSCAVQKMICSEITMAGGWIPFARYMELAIYSPGMGYYCTGTTKFGCAGDFVTAPEVSSLFGRTIAQQAAQIIKNVGEDRGDILEFGAGTGKLALDILLELENLNRLPQNYFILEVSGELQERQNKLFEKYLPHLLSRIKWLGNLPSKFNGLILANEVLDAMPVHLVVWHSNSLFERGVVWDGKKFEWSDRLLIEGELFKTAQEIIPRASLNNRHIDTYISEINLSVRGFIKSLANILQDGAVVFIDYGFGRNEYYHYQRNHGTLMCHYRHHAHDDPFYLPGLQDITSHVDFTAITDAATGEGLELLGYASQAQFLINCGITKILAQIPVENTGDYLPMANQLQKLVSPAEMGELFKVIALGKDTQQSLIGFSSGDKSFLLEKEM
jgi:SAM-dependent MidA family methyltransferase